MLATRRRRLTSFFFLYLTEGIPNGFALVALVTQMRRQGVAPADIGVFAAAFGLPWAFKWVMGPAVDLFYSDRLGRRRLWIVAMQLGMCVTLLAAIPFDFATRIKALSWLIVLHNVFAATQDVAIDALACGTLEEHERGTANGLMFAGSYAGAAVGGSGVLFLLGLGVPLHATYYFVIGAVLAVTLLVALRLREPAREETPAVGATWRSLVLALRAYCKEACGAFFGTRAAAVGLAVALLPMGAYALSLALTNNLAVELGMSDTFIAKLTLACTLITALACVLGGYLSDRFGRRRTLAFYVAGTAVPTLLMAWGMYRLGWIFPVPVDLANRPVPPQALIWLYVGAGLLYSLFQGLMYGTRTALFMDVCHPAVAATQFTAYMALLNLVISYSTYWQCGVVTKLGYPLVMTLDAGLGLVCLFLLPFMAKQAG